MTLSPEVETDAFIVHFIFKNAPFYGRSKRKVTAVHFYGVTLLPRLTAIHHMHYLAVS